MTVLIIIVVFVIAVGCWGVFTKSGQAFAEQERRKKVGQTISHAGTRSGGGGLACPKCGGTQFKAHRKTSTKLAFGAASLLGQAKWVRCVTCAADYRRG